jgi:hypothetical protein
MRVESTYQTFVSICEYCDYTWRAVVEGARIVWDDEQPEKASEVFPPKLECPNCSKMTT